MENGPQWVHRGPAQPFGGRGPSPPRGRIAQHDRGVEIFEPAFIAARAPRASATRVFGLAFTQPADPRRCISIAWWKRNFGSFRRIASFYEQVAAAELSAGSASDRPALTWTREMALYAVARQFRDAWRLTCSRSSKVALPEYGAGRNPPAAVDITARLLNTCSQRPALMRRFQAEAKRPGPAARVGGIRRPVISWKRAVGKA